MNHSFICAGFPKSATTTIDAILRQHPDICLPCHKETIFFKDYNRNGHTMEWYEKRYYGNAERKRNNKIYGEINPQNILNGNREKKILREFGANTKFIYTMRNPVDALFSIFRFYALIGVEYEGWYEQGCTTAFDIYLEQNLNHYSIQTYEHQTEISLFLYGRYLATALKHVPRENMLLIEFDDFIRDTEGQIKKILEFIGARTDVALNYHIKANDGNRLPIGGRVRERVLRRRDFWYRTYVEKVPYLGRRLERIMDDWYWNIQVKGSVPVKEKIRMSDQAREKLYEYYYNDVALLDQVMGTNYLEKWGFAERK